jgi:hypothetical protein
MRRFIVSSTLKTGRDLPGAATLPKIVHESIYNHWFSKAVGLPPLNLKSLDKTGC